MSLYNIKLGDIYSEFSQSTCNLVIDCGHSFTNIVPFFENQAIQQGIKRINVGGKLLSNYLKEMISTRIYDIRSNYFLANQIKERECYVANDYFEEIKLTESQKSNGKKIEIIPNGNKTPIEILLKNETFACPEIIFNPSYIGINQAGLAESIVQSINSCDKRMQAAFYSNILLTGGSVLFNGFQERLEYELRKLVDCNINIQITKAKDPVTCAWEGAAKFCNQNELDPKMMITKSEFLETGNKF